VGGVVEVTGFAIDTKTITHVEIWVDGVYIGEAEIGLDSPDFAELYPWMPYVFSSTGGFEYQLDTLAANLADGEHILVVWTQDRLFGRSMIGQRRFVLDNQSP
jgi:hypothetical protein